MRTFRFVASLNNAAARISSVNYWRTILSRLHGLVAETAVDAHLLRLVALHAAAHRDVAFAGAIPEYSPSLQLSGHIEVPPASAEAVACCACDDRRGRVLTSRMNPRNGRHCSSSTRPFLWYHLLFRSVLLSSRRLWPAPTTAPLAALPPVAAPIAAPAAAPFAFSPVFFCGWSFVAGGGGVDFAGCV